MELKPEGLLLSKQEACDFANVCAIVAIIGCNRESISHIPREPKVYERVIANHLAFELLSKAARDSAETDGVTIGQEHLCRAAHVARVALANQEPATSYLRSVPSYDESFDFYRKDPEAVLDMTRELVGLIDPPEDKDT